MSNVKRRKPDELRNLNNATMDDDGKLCINFTELRKKMSNRKYVSDQEKKDFIEAVKDKLKSAGVTHAELSYFVGVHAVTISNWVRLKTFPSPETVFLLEKFIEAEVR